mmetsp:Transcript_8331/g.51947  ORF Transcript_8331/g.51947 Transcript_8331/m.51947 type:complete len:81 (-) Transcript_8331:2037-2279(-)
MQEKHLEQQAHGHVANAQATPKRGKRGVGRVKHVIKTSAAAAPWVDMVQRSLRIHVFRSRGQAVQKGQINLGGHGICSEM